MTKFLVTCTKIYNGTMFVDAENNEEALEIAQNKLNENVDCINWDFGEATADIADEEEVILDGDGEEESHLSPDYEPKHKVGECVGNVRWGYFTITEIKDGKYIFENGDEEPIATFDANEDNHIETFHREDFQPFDKVLVRDDDYFTWVADFFSHNDEHGYLTSGGLDWCQCVPYNSETAHLLGTTTDYHGKYKTW